MKGKIYTIKPTIRSFPIIIFIIIICIAVNGYFFKVEYDSMTTMISDVEEERLEDNWEIVAGAIQENYNNLVADSKFISKKIEAAILKEYASEMNTLQEEFNKNIFSDRLYRILEKELEQDSKLPNNTLYNKDYHYVLGFSEGIFATFRSVKDELRAEPIDNLIGWHQYFNNDLNETLVNDLINRILTKDINGKVLLYQSGELDGVNIKEHSISSLKDVYDAHGLNGFKNINFTTVAYITEEGDIFNTGDYSYLEPNDNYKIILVQHCNIYDAIIDDVSPVLKMKEQDYEKFTIMMTQEIIRDSLSFVVINGLLIIIVLVFSVFYNKNCDEKQSS